MSTHALGEATCSPCSAWHKRSRFAKAVNGWFSYQLASWVSLFFPVEVDKAMHVSLCEQFPDFPKRKPNAKLSHPASEPCLGVGSCGSVSGGSEGCDVLKDKIIIEMTLSIKNLGAKSDLLGIICSYGEALSDSDILALLKEWNSHGPVGVEKTKPKEPNASAEGRGSCATATRKVLK